MVKSDADINHLSRWVKSRPKKRASPYSNLYRLRIWPKTQRNFTTKCVPSLIRQQEWCGKRHRRKESDRGLTWKTEVTEEEAKWVATVCGDKASGIDRTTVWLLGTACTSVGKAATKLDSRSPQHGHFPNIFEMTEAILLPKAGLDPSTPKRWRPISLLLIEQRSRNNSRKKSNFYSSNQPICPAKYFQSSSRAPSQWLCNMCGSRCGTYPKFTSKSCFCNGPRTRSFWRCTSWTISWKMKGKCWDRKAIE